METEQEAVDYHPRKYYIDQRPLHILFLIQYKNAFFLLALGILFVRLMAVDSLLPGLNNEAYRGVVIFGLAVVLWVTNILPLAITSLLVMGLLASYQVMDKNTVYAFFGDSALFFILGAFIISAALSATGLTKRLAYFVLQRYGRTPYRMVASIFVTAGLMSFLMPEHAVAAMLFPIALQVSRTLDLQKGTSTLGKFLFFGLAWGAVIGGVATFLGGARNPLAVGILKSDTGLDISFLEWTVAVAPIALTMMALVLLFIKLTVKFEDIDFMRGHQHKARERMGKLSFREVRALVILAVTLYLWIFHSNSIGIANIALISGAMYFVLNVVTWDEVAREINWGAIFMYGGAITLGKSLSSTGFLDWLINNYLSQWHLGGTAVLAVVALVSLVLTEGVSNAAVVGMLMPVVLKFLASIGMDPRLAAYIVAVPAGLGFMLPMGTPGNAICFTSGYYSIRESVKYGFLLNVIALIVVMLAALYYWPLLGINI